MPKLFISYRHEDSAGHVGRIFDRLRQTRDNRDGGVFMDVASIRPGVNFTKCIQAAIAVSDVVLIAAGSSKPDELIGCMEGFQRSCQAVYDLCEDPHAMQLPPRALADLQGLDEWMSQQAKHLKASQDQCRRKKLSAKSSSSSPSKPPSRRGKRS